VVRYFPLPSRPNQPSVQWVPAVPGENGRSVALTRPHLAPEVNTRLELCLYPASGPLGEFYRYLYNGYLKFPPGSAVGTATAYGLDGPGIESWWGRDFPHLSRPTLRPTRLLYNRYRVFPGGKVRPGRDADPSLPSSAEVKNRVELYLYSP
jgi:hypothetical protein